MKILEDNVSERDAPTVARNRQGGAVMLGKTNIPEMAMDYDCETRTLERKSHWWRKHQLRRPAPLPSAARAGIASGWTRWGTPLSQVGR
jgi:Asp-tRNA(Asn)/Glu-tRNA(Gln) amidotransferase A subunit family amidase